MSDFINEIKLNENNIQAPFQYLIGEDSFELIEYSNEFILNINDPRLKYRDNQKYFIVDLGASIDCDIYQTNILIDNVKIYPVRVGNIEEIKDTIINENNFAFIANDNNFKSIIILPKNNINKRLKYTIYTYATSLSSYMFNEVAKKLNTLDINYPIKNLYLNFDYKVNDIIKYNGYLYRVLKDFKNTVNNDKLLNSNTTIITPFKRLSSENKDYKIYDVVEIDNKYFVVQSPFNSNENITGKLSPLINIIDWDENIEQLYKNTILIKDSKKYLVIADVKNPIWKEVYNNQIIELIKANEILTDNNETIQESLNRIDNNIETEIENRINSDNTLQTNINNEAIIREERDNDLQNNIDTLDKIKQDNLQNGIDNKIHYKTYNIRKTFLELDKSNPIIMDSNSIEINVNTDGIFTVELEAENLTYKILENNIIVNKVVVDNNEDKEIDYSGKLIITATKDTDLENVYNDNIIILYINSNTLYTTLSVENDTIIIEPNNTVDLVLNTNANTDNIEYSIDNPNYEITKNNKTLSIRNIIEENSNDINNKLSAILTITAIANSTDEITYVASTINIYINKSKEETISLLTIDCLSNQNAIQNTLVKRDNKGQVFGNNIDNLSLAKDELLINKKTLLQEKDNLRTEILQEIKEEDTGLQNQINDLNHNKQNNLTAGYNVHLEDDIISLKGGVSKNYIVEDEYRVNDFIFHENRLYRVNRIFVASNWETDKSYLTLVSANDVASVATEVAYDNGESGLDAKNVQDALDKLADRTKTNENNITTNKNSINTLNTKVGTLEKRYMIPPWYIQFANSSGTFDSNEAPNNWYKKMYGIDTTWELMFSSDSVYFRTEGSLASSGRSRGLQTDAIRNITGSLINLRFRGGIIGSGAFSNTYQSLFPCTMDSSTTDSNNIDFNASRVVPTASENRTRNRLIRVYHLLSINSVNVSDILRR